MHEVTIRDYIGYAKELTAEQVRKLDPGTRIVRHSFDRMGVHQTREMTVVKSGRTRVLAYTGYDGLTDTMSVLKETDRMCYTEAGK